MKAKKTAPAPLLEIVPRLTPRFVSPRHLAPVAALFDRIASGEENVQAAVSCPPRHGKTELEKAAIVRHLLQHPDDRIGLASYSAAFAEKKSREIREMFLRVGGKVAADAKKKSDWRVRGGTGEGGLWAGGVEGAWTGEGFDLLVLDDVIKDRARAESQIEREKLWSWFNDVGRTRLEPGGSCVSTHARWTQDDLNARLLAEGFEEVTLPAIDSEGRALWPARWPIGKLRRLEEAMGRYSFAGLYQQAPIARGGQMFVGTFFYDSLPEGLRFAAGLDFAYSVKSRADWSVLVILAELNGVYYVIDVIRLQVAAPDFKRTIDGLATTYREIRPFTYVGGQEKGVVELMNEQGGVQIDHEPAVVAKFVRAQNAAAAWTNGKILVPREATWLTPFLNEVLGFTGDDARDDQVDALVGAFDRAARSARTGVPLPKCLWEGLERERGRRWGEESIGDPRGKIGF